MSRYYKAESVKDEIVRVLEHTDCNNSYIDDVLRAIEKLPTIDIVECAECANNKCNIDRVAENWCLLFGYDVESDDFCSNGERIDNE